MTKHVLMIAYHFPPMKGSSGIQRTLKFSQYLPYYGWEPVVLSADKRAYEAISEEQLGDIPDGMLLSRAFALDTKRHLSINDHYPGFLAIPDRWMTWFFGGVAAGLGLIRKSKPAVIWSTYPIATAHLIAYALHRLTGIPWVVDMRDPMVQDGYPADPLQWKAFKWIEDKIALHASAICFTSPSAIDYFIDKHGGTVSPSKLYLIENGYDEQSFKEAEKLATINPPKPKRPFLLLHSGIVYPSERDPRPFFQAVSNLKNAKLLDATSVQIIFRASGHDTYLEKLINDAAIDDILKLAPPLPYVEALAEMLNADGLLLFQASNCNYQIPAKVYEYIRAERPVFGLTDSKGDTANLLHKFANNMVVDIACSSDIEKMLPVFIDTLSLRSEKSEAAPEIGRYSRQDKSRELAVILELISQTS